MKFMSSANFYRNIESSEEGKREGRPLSPVRTSPICWYSRGSLGADVFRYRPGVDRRQPKPTTEQVSPGRDSKEAKVRRQSR